MVSTIVAIDERAAFAAHRRLQEDPVGERAASESDRDVGGHVGACVVVGEQPEQHLLAGGGVRTPAADLLQPRDRKIVEAWLRDRVQDQPSLQATAEFGVGGAELFQPMPKHCGGLVGVVQQVELAGEQERRFCSSNRVFDQLVCLA
jgi:hypothetical protein